MDKEKQIEEMANAYYEAMLKARNSLGSMNEGAPKWYAKELYNAGYCKASDVAREIFEEIENALELLRRAVKEGQKNDGIKYQQLHDGRILSIEAIKYFIAELKKKYTEEKG